MIAFAAVAGVVIGLVIWAPWASPPLLRPAGGPPRTAGALGFGVSATEHAWPPGSRLGRTVVGVGGLWPGRSQTRATAGRAVPRS